MMADADKRREYRANWYREKNLQARDIPAPPKVKNWRRRKAAATDLHSYLTTYHKAAFPLRFSEDHLKLIEETQRVILQGGQVVAAFPRGSGKTTIFVHAEVWAALYGHRRFPMLICADDIKFRQLLSGIKKILENNVLLLEDFPEVLQPIKALDRIALRANFQTCQGEPTYARWGQEQIIFATTKWTKERGNAGVVIGGGGLTGAAVRGGVITTPVGEQLRPDCALIDDPQTRKSAKSQSQCQEREDICNGDILGMAGPGKKLATMCALTVIYQHDLADRLLDKQRSPSWLAIKVPMIKAWPAAMPLWEKYDAIRRQELFEEAEPGSATAYYAANRDEMDVGAVVYWEDRKMDGDLSALQSAMNDYFSNPRAFMAEKQNSPDVDVEGDLAEINPRELVRRTTPHKRGMVPADATVIVAHVDVQAKVLFWTVTAWTQNYGGYVIDYGTVPKISRRYFKLTDIKKDLTAAYPGTDEPGALRAAIRDVVTMLSEKVWKRTDDADMRLDRGLVDARWQVENVEAGLALCANHRFSPSYGVGIRAKDAPLANWTKKVATVRGHNWLIQKPALRRFPGVFYDTNYWKSQAHQALMVPIEHTQSVALFADNQSAHQLFADHCTAEHAVRVEARGRIVDEWDLPSNKPDNHYWDTLVGCFVAASMCGIRKGTETNGRTTAKRTVGKRVKQLAI